jgi:SAM-dependent methyltransferase
MAKEFDLAGIVPWGRRLDEYRAFFALNDLDRSAKPILDVGAGPSSFAAEASETGFGVVAVDPLYAFDGPSIRARFEATRGRMMEGVRRAHERFDWSFYGSPEALERRRAAALEVFLGDYDSGRANGRYRVRSPPSLPFADTSFGLALCSHLLFLYSDELDLGFHLAAIVELLRVADEARIFPLADLAGTPSAHLPSVIAGLREQGLVAKLVPVPFEFQRGARQMLRVRARRG